jgi:hypothetical protein
MKKALPIVCMLLFGASPAFADLYRVVASDRGSVTVEFTIPAPTVVPATGEGSERTAAVSVEGFFTLDRDGWPLLPVRRFMFEVPSTAGVTMQILDEERSTIDGVRPRFFLDKPSAEGERRALEEQPRLAEQSFARLAGVGTFRGRHIAFVDLYPVLFDPERRRLSCARRLVVRLAFPQAAEAPRGTAPRPLYGNLCVNSAQAATWSHAPAKAPAGARTPFEFARSTHWIKIRVQEKAIYTVTYDDILGLGVDPSSIDPATLRLFAGGAYQQPDSISNGGSFLDDYHLSEHAVLYRGAGSGEFSPGDTIFFYGLGASGWEKDYDPSKDARTYHKHLYAVANVYWLTWGGSFSGAPRRVEVRDVAPHGAADTVITSYEERMHNEEDELFDPIYTDDRWYWSLLREGGVSTFVHDFYCYDLAGPNGILKTLGYGPRATDTVESAQYFVNDVLAGSLSWSPAFDYYPQAMRTLLAPISNLVQGRSNTFKVTKALDNEAYVLWYEIFYQRLLKARLGVLDFFAPQRPLTASYALSGFPQGERLLFDVTFDESPVLCTGWQASTGGIAFEDSLAGRPRHYMAVSRSAFKKAALEARAVPSLRDESECPNMVIIYNARFQHAAFMLRDLRVRSLPGVANPVVKAVDIDDVYNNFSGGLKDPVAIRNYLKFLYDNGSCAPGGDPALRYVLLVGNGTYDTRDVLKQGNDFVPLYFNLRYRNESEGVEDEDFFVKLDAGFDPVPDLAIGRMSVLTDQEGTAWANRIVEYEERPEFGAWRDKVILCADDEHSTNSNADFDFQEATEQLAGRTGPFPTLIDIRKIYLHLYPFVGDVKPAARRDFLGEWSEGALIVNFNGHGSPVQMADERVMVASDVYSLTNASRRPLFLSFSCSVGDLESPYQRSMAQNLVTYDKGGAIGTIAAAAPTYLYPNNLLNAEIFASLFTSKDSTGTEPVGYALQLAKMSIASTQSYYESNNAKYILLGDPALKLAVPAYTVRHETESIATMQTGHRYRVDGSVQVGGRVDASFNGSADVVVQEAEKSVMEAGFTRPYAILGRELFRGTFDVVQGRFSADFVVPARCRTGFGARIRTYVTASTIDGAGACDTLRIELADTLPANTGPPTVNLFFAGGATKVKQGAKLIAEISDPDGIAILGADPQSSIFLEFDGSGYPVYVTDFFTYDHGSSTKGTVEYPLQPGFDPGPHMVQIKAFDNLGESSSDTLRFEIVEEGIYTVSDVFNFPNPFSAVTNFVFQVTSRADALLSVYSVSGVRVWERRVSADEGFNSIVWDGRDSAGDRIANGTYLYVLKVDFRDSFHREETVRGKVVILR